jgi:homospermidine synthase
MTSNYNSPSPEIVFIGFGAVAKTLMTLVYKIEPLLITEKVLIIEPQDITGLTIIQKLFNFTETSKNVYTDTSTAMWLKEKLTKENYSVIFEKYIKDNSIIIDLSYRVDTSCILSECNKKKCLYINTAIDVFERNPRLGDESLIEIKNKILETQSSHRPTAILNHGMNPGLVSHFVKYFLKKISKSWEDTEAHNYCITNKYNLCAEKLGLSLIQVSERDTQYSNSIRTTEKKYVNTWSIIGLIDEAFDMTQMSWGTHEEILPIGSNISLLESYGQISVPIWGSQVKTMSYEPKGGKFTGYNIPHAESYSLVEFLKTPTYRPSVYYSYLIPDDAKIMMAYAEYSMNKEDLPIDGYHVLRSDEITGGKNAYDSVGCLMYFRRPEGLKTYWVGSIVNNDFASELSPEINSTCIQVAISILSAIKWMLKPENKNKGIIEPEQIDSDFVVEYCKPFLGDFVDGKDVTHDYKPQSDKFSDLSMMSSVFFI